MTKIVSVALFKRDGALTFRPPRKERSSDQYNARKSAMRYWNGKTQAPDKLVKVIIITKVEHGTVYFAERSPQVGKIRPWLEDKIPLEDAANQPHILACLHEMDIDLNKRPVTAMPDTLEINGIIYRREI